MTVHCPKCGGTEIREKNVAYANLEVLEWEWDEEAQGAQPIDYDTDVGADWEVDDVAKQYLCGNPACPWEGTLDELRVER